MGRLGPAAASGACAPRKGAAGKRGASRGTRKGATYVSDRKPGRRRRGPAARHRPAGAAEPPRDGRAGEGRRHPAIRATPHPGHRLLRAGPPAGAGDGTEPRAVRAGEADPGAADRRRRRHAARHPLEEELAGIGFAICDWADAGSRESGRKSQVLESRDVARVSVVEQRREDVRRGGAESRLREGPWIPHETPPRRRPDRRRHPRRPLRPRRRTRRRTAPPTPLRPTTPPPTAPAPATTATAPSPRRARRSRTSPATWAS